MKWWQVVLTDIFVSIVGGIIALTGFNLIKPAVIPPAKPDVIERIYVVSNTITKHDTEYIKIYPITTNPSGNVETPYETFNIIYSDHTTFTKSNFVVNISNKTLSVFLGNKSSVYDISKYFQGREKKFTVGVLYDVYSFSKYLPITITADYNLLWDFNVSALLAADKVSVGVSYNF